MVVPVDRPPGRAKRVFRLLKQALGGGEADYTEGSIRRAVLLLAIPMMLEMTMESVFALVDLYFVGHLPDSSFAIQTVGLTESVLTVIYSTAIGISMAATAVVARRVGEKNPGAAARVGAQSLLIALLRAHPRIQRPARISREADRPAHVRLGDIVDDPLVAEQQPHAAQLVVNQRVHRIQHQRPHRRPLPASRPALGLSHQLAQDWQ